MVIASFLFLLQRLETAEAEGRTACQRADLLHRKVETGRAAHRQECEAIQTCLEHARQLTVTMRQQLLSDDGSSHASARASARSTPARRQPFANSPRRPTTNSAGDPLSDSADAAAGQMASSPLQLLDDLRVELTALEHQQEVFTGAVASREARLRDALARAASAQDAARGADTAAQAELRDATLQLSELRTRLESLKHSNAQLQVQARETTARAEAAETETAAHAQQLEEAERARREAIANLRGVWNMVLELRHTCFDSTESAAASGAVFTAEGPKLARLMAQRFEEVQEAFLDSRRALKRAREVNADTAALEVVGVGRVLDACRCCE